MNKGDKLVALKGKVIVQDLDCGEVQTSNGVLLTDDNGKLQGVHPRWAKVYSVGQGVNDIKVGQYILIAHGRWSRTITVNDVKINLIDYPTAVIAKSDEQQEPVYMNNDF